MAKYPFLPEAANYVGKLDLKIEDLSKPEYASILRRAINRIEKALSNGLVDWQSHEEIEIISFPIAVMIVAATKDIHLKRRYALAEAKRVYNLLKNEAKEKMIEVAKTFNWRIKPLEKNKITIYGEAYDYALNFVDYLRNVGNLREKKWKLINRLLVDGNVYLTRVEAARLLAEEVRKRIEKKLNMDVPKLPQNLMEHVNRLEHVFKQKRKIRLEEAPKGVVIEAFPPCIKKLYEALSSGQHISHIGRFALTSFLINIGMSVEDVIELFQTLSDFNERMTRYQVEHIAGERGSRTKYTPPSCDTLKTHGVCPGMDEICRRIRHPLTYYKRKFKALRRKVSAQQT